MEYYIVTNGKVTLSKDGVKIITKIINNNTCREMEALTTCVKASLVRYRDGGTIAEWKMQSLTGAMNHVTRMSLEPSFTILLKLYYNYDSVQFRTWDIFKDKKRVLSFSEESCKEVESFKKALELTNTPYKFKTEEINKGE